eukprot:gene16580-8004_t
MANLVIIALLATTVAGMPPLKQGNLDCDCAARICVPVLKCEDGFIGKDECKCCNICIKKKEMSKCGGIDNMGGACDKGMICRIRHPNSGENIHLPIEAKYGRCEKAACRDVTCGKHQWCSVMNGKPTCSCHLKCNERKKEPVCGLKDGKNYPNHCVVRKHECETQKDIGYLPGPCVPCQLNNKEYKFGDVVPSGEQCESCTCRHGRWICSFSLSCLKKEVYKGYECTGYTKLHDEILCGDGFKCKFTKMSDGKAGLPDLGVCERLNPAKTCGLPSESGSCYGYFKRWYFDVKSRACKKFIYGGCEGNDNRFKSLGVCKQICSGYTGPEINPDIIIKDETEIPVVPEKPLVPVKPDVKPDIKPDRKPDLPDVPSKPDVPKVPVKPDVPKVPMKPDVPKVPMKPHIPKVPVKPDFPKVPVKPDVPEVPEKPDIPENPKMPEKPSVTEIPPIAAFELSKKTKIGNIGKFSVESPDAPIQVRRSAPAIKVSVKKEPLSGCKFQNNTYKAGEEFISGDCRGKCKCYGDNNLGCVSLCPPEQVVCGPNEKRVQVKVPVGSSKCTCTRDRCVKSELEPMPFTKDQADEVITIRGKVTFEKSPGKLPTPSCLRVVFEDVSVQDDGSVVYKTEEFNVSNSDISAHYDYKFKTKKPKTHHEFYAVSAVLNVGWCASPDSNDWIRNFDFLSDSTIYVPLRDGTTDYEVDVPVIYYCRGKKCPATNEKAQPEAKSEILGETPPIPDLLIDPYESPEPPHGILGDPTEADWVDDYVRAPEYGPGNITIHGKLKFNKSPGKLPKKSCLRISFQDTGLADTSSVSYKEDVLDLSGVEIGNVYEYKLMSRRPQRTFGFSVSATLNVGWCPDKDSKQWLKNKDFLTDTMFNVKLKPDSVNYEKDLNLVYYCYGADCPVKKPKKLPSKIESKSDLKDQLNMPPIQFSSEISEKPEYPKTGSSDAWSVNGKLRSIPVSEMKSGSKNMTIQGVMMFNKIPGKLPAPSCLKLFFEDISFQDVKSVLYAAETWDMSGIELQQKFKYSFLTKKPKDLKSVYSVGIVLNVGWCPGNETTSWIRNNDYLSDSSLKVPLKEDEDTYIRDIPIVFYCRGPTCTEKGLPVPATTEAPPSTENPDIVAPIRQLDDSSGKGESSKKDPKTEGETKKVSTEEKPKPLPVSPPLIEPIKPRRHSKCIDYETKIEYNIGDEWYGSDDCIHCTCSRDGYPVCSSPMCALPFCRTGPARPQKGRCCPVCPEHHVCKKSNGRVVVEHERWQENNCSVCECTTKGIVCVDPSSVKQNCKRRQRWNGKCEPICIDDIIPPRKLEKPKFCNKPDGTAVSFASEWNIDNCTACRCTRSYGVLCRSPDCDFTDNNCQKLVDVPGECCPACQLKKCHHRYRYYSEGEKVIKDDRRTVCECKEGDWSCDDPPTGKNALPFFTN